MDMLYTRESLGAPYADDVGRAHEERARAISTMLTGAATGLGNLAATIGRGLGQAGRSIASGVVAARRRRVAMHQLQALDDRMLKDIGISRGEIPFLVERMSAAERSAPTGSGRGCDIAVFPGRQATTECRRVRLRPAA
jgi:uncharacterized protein YjiS (DUF1127 family)